MTPAQQKLGQAIANEEREAHTTSVLSEDPPTSFVPPAVSRETVKISKHRCLQILSMNFAATASKHGITYMVDGEIVSQKIFESLKSLYFSVAATLGLIE